MKIVMTTRLYEYNDTLRTLYKTDTIDAFGRLHPFKETNTHDGLLVFFNDQCIGFMEYAHTPAMLYKIFVHPHYRTLGVGTLMMSYLSPNTRFVVPVRLSAVHFYKRLGCRITTVTERFYYMETPDAQIDPPQS